MNKLNKTKNANNKIAFFLLFSQMDSNGVYTSSISIQIVTFSNEYYDVFNAIDCRLICTMLFDIDSVILTFKYIYFLSLCSIDVKKDSINVKKAVNDFLFACLIGAND